MGVVRSTVLRPLIVGATALGLLAATSLPVTAATAAARPAASAGQPQPLPIGTLANGLLADLTAWWTAPPGSNIWSCKPTAAHPYPVILLHGTFASSAVSWQALSPMLYNAGYCVYTLDYGQTVPGPFYGTGDAVASAKVVAKFVQRVLDSTGAKQVDFVGHSQGGMLPRYYMKFLGGARYVHMLVGLAPSNHGTTELGLGTLVADLAALGLPLLSLIGCVSCQQQLVGSSFLNKLNTGGDTLPGPQYVVIETSYDEIVTPYTSAFLSGPNVQNIDLQQQCSDDFSDHLGLLYDPNALQDVMNALGPDDPNFQPSCVPTFPVVG